MRLTVNGVRVNLCVTMFSGHSTFFSSSISQQTLISNLIGMIQSRGAHGVNIDFEGIPSSQKTNFTNFMINLATQMHAAIPNSQVSTVLYAVDWGDVFDVATLAPHVDLFVLMGYGYYWTNSSTAGPVDPLYHYISNSYKYSLYLHRQFHQVPPRVMLKCVIIVMVIIATKYGITLVKPHTILT